MKSYYVTTQPGPGGNHEVHKVGCSHLPMERRYIGEFTDLDQALQHVRYTHANAANCPYCAGANEAGCTHQRTVSGNCQSV